MSAQRLSAVSFRKFCSVVADLKFKCLACLHDLVYCKFFFWFLFFFNFCAVSQVVRSSASPLCFNNDISVLIFRLFHVVVCSIRLIFGRHWR